MLSILMKWRPQNILNVKQSLEVTWSAFLCYWQYIFYIYNVCLLNLRNTIRYIDPIRLFLITDGIHLLSLWSAFHARMPPNTALSPLLCVDLQLFYYQPDVIWYFLSETVTAGTSVPNDSKIILKFATNGMVFCF